MTKPHHEGSCEEENHQMTGCWNHIPNIRQFVGEPSSKWKEWTHSYKNSNSMEGMYGLQETQQSHKERSLSTTIYRSNVG